MITGDLHAHDETIGQLQSDMNIIGDQSLQTITQPTAPEQRIERLEKEMVELAANNWKSPNTYEWRPDGSPSMYSQAAEAPKAAPRP